MQKSASSGLSDPVRPPTKIALWPEQQQGWGGGAVGHQLVWVAGAAWGSWLLGNSFECDLMMSLPLIKQPLLR